jgi:hypothetical protein
LVIPVTAETDDMKLRILLPAALSFAMLAAIPVSTSTQAMSLAGGIAKSEDGLITSVAAKCHPTKGHKCKKPKRKAFGSGRD